MDHKNKKRIKILYAILLLSLVTLSAVYIANIVAEAKYEQAMSRLKELLSDPDLSFGKDPQESKVLIQEI